MAPRVGTALASAAVATYPVLAYAGMRFGVPMRWLALGLLAVMAARWGLPLARRAPLLLAALAAGAGLLAWTRSEAAVLFYPVAVNAALLAVFGLSLRFGPPAVERLARLRHPDLDAAGVRHTRRATVAWCAFFAVNGILALATALSGDSALWALYNGVLAYALMGLMFAGEFLARRRALAAGRA